jgi:hypothetical protein
VSQRLFCKLSSVPTFKISLLLGTTQLLMFFMATLTYLETKLFLLIAFYTGAFLIIKALIAFKMCIYFFSHSIIDDVIDCHCVNGTSCCVFSFICVSFFVFCFASLFARAYSTTGLLVTK